MPTDVNPLAHTIAENCIAVRVRKLNRMITAIYDEGFRPLGLTVAQFNLLVAIASFDQITPKKLADTLSLEKSSLSRNIEKMNARGWVKVGPGEDQRSHDLSLTEAGKKLLAEAKPAWDKAQEQTKKIVGNDLSNLFAKVRWS